MSRGAAPAVRLEAETASATGHTVAAARANAAAAASTATAANAAIDSVDAIDAAAAAGPAEHARRTGRAAFLAAPASPFDGAAADYDRSFTGTPLGGCLRRAVWRRLDACFAPGDRVLELGCGTGEDALRLVRRGVEVVATDAAPAMVEAARRKLAAAGFAATRSGSEFSGGRTRGRDAGSDPGSGEPGNEPGAGAGAEVRRLAIEDLAGEPAVRPFDGAFANFGAVNCVGDLPALARALAPRLRPGAPVLLCVMGPLAPWEWLWLLRRGQPREVFRRLRRGGVAWRGLTVRYPSIGRLRRAFAADFRLRRVSAVGALLPTTCFAPWAARHPRLLAALDRLERRLERVPPLPWLADHYLAELVRTSRPPAPAPPAGGNSPAVRR